MSSGFATRRVLEALGLDPVEDGPLIEWQTPAPAAPTPASIEHVGDTILDSDSTTKTTIDLPAGTQSGDLLVLSMVTGGLAGSMPTCDDGRMEISHQYPSFNISAHALVGYGFADGSGTPLSITLHDGESAGGAVLSAYRVTGVISALLAHGNVGTGDDVTFVTPIPDGADLAVMATAGHVNSDPLTGWALDAQISSSTGWARTWRPTDTPPEEASNGHGWWLALTIGLAEAPGSVDELVWTADPVRSRSLMNYQIGYGRTDAVSKVAPLQCTVRAASVIASAPEIGDLFRITLCAAAAAELGLTEDQAARFTGEITDVQLDPDSRTWTVIGVHQLARESLPTLDLTLAGPATIHDRVLQILTAVGADVGVIDAGGQTVAAPADLAAASALLDLVSDSGPGQIVTQPNGVVDWHGREHRRGVVSSLTLEASEILSRITWAKHVGSVVNIATITWAGGTVVVTDSASVVARGPYTTSVATALVVHDDAVSVGILVVGRRSLPAWAVPTLLLDVARTVDVAHLADVLKARHSDRITVNGLPDTGPIVGSFDFFLEGYQESAAPRSWQIGLSVTDPSLSGVSIRWMDVDPGLHWGDVDAAIRWLDVARIEDGTGLGIPTYAIDGGDAATTTFHESYDGGTAATTTVVRTIDGGAAA